MSYSYHFHRLIITNILRIISLNAVLLKNDNKTAFIIDDTNI